MRARSGDVVEVGPIIRSLLRRWRRAARMPLWPVAARSGDASRPQAGSRVDVSRAAAPATVDRRCNDCQMTDSTPARSARGTAAEDEVAALASDLIRIDTSNPGDHSGPGERAAAEYVGKLLAEVGVEPTLLESHERRASVVARI